MIRKAPKYSEQIEEIKKTLGRLTQEIAHINDQQADLDLGQAEYPIVSDLKIKIKPYEELWNLRNQFDKLCMNDWVNSRLGDLNPETVDQEFKRMYQRAAILANTFGNMPNVTRPRGVA